MLSELEKKILNAVQENFPLVPRPYEAIAKNLRMDEKALIEKLTSLNERGYLKRIGAYFDSEALGYRGALVALRVAPELLPSVAEAVNQYDVITHNYEREGEYNLWFTVQTENPSERNAILKKIGAFPGVESILLMPTDKKYKARVQFRLD